VPETCPAAPNSRTLCKPGSSRGLARGSAAADSGIRRISLGIPLTMVFPPRSKFFTHADRATATRTTWSSQKHRAESMKKALVDRYQRTRRLSAYRYGSAESLLVVPECWRYARVRQVSVAGKDRSPRARLRA